MTDIEIIANHVKDRWNFIAAEAVDFMKSKLDYDLTGDAIYAALSKVDYPWRIGVADHIQAGKPIAFVEFGFRPDNDRRVVCGIISAMAYILREESRSHLIAVLDRHDFGFGITHQGADDVTIQELFPFGRVN